MTTYSLAIVSGFYELIIILLAVIILFVSGEQSVH